MDPKAIAAGIAMRRKVMGDKHVAKRQSSDDRFTRQQQELVNGFSWGQIWTRPQLTLKERSLVTLAFICAADRMDELPGHVRGALNNGATPDEIVEVFVQAAVYCGFPSSNTAVRRCVEVFREDGIL
jgi:alkylhydroperoxidase/carboxymuconolactone decarboxylase family protein YurZ